MSTGRSLFERAPAGGNRALGVGTGDFAPGSPADIVTFACDYPTLAQRERGDAILDGIIFGGSNRQAIRDVRVCGKRVAANGQPIRRERAQVGFRRAMRRVLSA